MVSFLIVMYKCTASILQRNPQLHFAFKEKNKKRMLQSYASTLKKFQIKMIMHAWYYIN